MRRIRFIVIPLILLLAAGAVLYMRPVPQLSPVSLIVTPPKTQAVSLPWPATGQAAIGADGYGVLDSHNAAAPLPVASTAKIITALAVLEKKPLTVGSQGPNITLDATDLGYFSYYSVNDGSVAKITAGEQISEYQALQAMLIPSANNIADSLARWAFGSPAAYAAYANQMVKRLGATHTTVGNTNGFDDTTTSTADDMVKLGLAAIKNPMIMDVVGQKTASIPVQGEVKNVNWLLGTYGVIGIKTGNTDKAGGCYLFAAQRSVQGKNITVVGAVLGAPDLAAAISAAPSLLASADAGFQNVMVVNKSAALGTYSAPWGGSASLATNKDLSLLVWKGKDIKVMNDLVPLTTPAAAGDAVGSVSVASGVQSAGSPLYLTKNMPGPSWHWRIFHR